MILTGPQIAREVEQGRIKIDPFNPRRCTTNSYDLALGSRVGVYLDDILDPTREPKVEYREIPSTGYLLQRGDFVLGHTVERFGSDALVPIVHAKSGFARRGTFVHCTADLIDLGFYGCSTLQLYATLPTVLYPGTLVAQVSWWETFGEIDQLYSGKYQGADGPMPSRSHLDAWAVAARG
ncbi:dCTP deaminase domain-containing protein [Kitasatospora sp. NPDC098663]|uniref:dCTP deaminase n=1 Tax=Kitasatospora sp. NPDC098663 TaxID=3364096 RepID=UPI003808E7CE